MSERIVNEKIAYLIMRERPVAGRAISFTTCSWDSSKSTAFLLHWSVEGNHVSMSREPGSSRSVSIKIAEGMVSVALCDKTPPWDPPRQQNTGF